MLDINEKSALRWHHPYSILAHALQQIVDTVKPPVRAGGETHGFPKQSDRQTI